jgi:hypothetical protein
VQSVGDRHRGRDRATVLRHSDRVDAPDGWPRFGPVAQMYMRGAKTAILTYERWRGGPPEGATCADVEQSRRKLNEVARAVHEELVGMEASHRRIHGSAEGLTPVAERLPGGWRELEPLVHKVCQRAAPGDRPYSLMMSALGDELGLFSSRAE